MEDLKYKNNKEENKMSWADIQDDEETLEKEKSAYSNECQKQK